MRITKTFTLAQVASTINTQFSLTVHELAGLLQLLAQGLVLRQLQEVQDVGDVPLLALELFRDRLDRRGP